MLKNSIENLIQGNELSEAVYYQAIDSIISSDNDLQSAAFLSLLHNKIKTAEELTALVNAFKQKMIPINTPHKVLDIVGTGGDGANTINISTGSAILAASCGVKICKHGNRAVSSPSGSADVLEALGVNIHLNAKSISRCIDEVGIAFCFAPNFHPAIQKLRTIRKQLKSPSIFNILGPLLNPSNPAHLILGVYSKFLMPQIAKTLQIMGTERSLVVHGAGTDEISCLGPTKILEVTQQLITESTINPSEYGFSFCHLPELQGGDAKQNAEILLEIFSGKLNSAIANTLILNTAAALYLYGIHPSIKEGILHARENLESGQALNLLKSLVEFSHDE